MATLAHGNIVLWEGASLWLFAADVPQVTTAAHAHHAIQVTLALEGSFELRHQETLTRGPCAAIAPDTDHVYCASGCAAHLFIDPESTAGRAFSKTYFRGEGVCAIDWAPLEPFAHQLLEALRRKSPDSVIETIGRTIIDSLAGTRSPRAVDDRVAAMIRVSCEDFERREILAAAASAAGLSKTRASHLFVEEVGVPLKSYILWRRLREAVELRAAGATLTAAAHGAGFSDSAHFSRTFKRMFGLPANSLRLN